MRGGSASRPRGDSQVSSCSCRPVAMELAGSGLVWLQRVLKPLPILCRGLFRVFLPGAVGCQMTKLMRHPVTHPVFAGITVFINENAATVQVGEHPAGHPGRHMKTVHVSRINVLPVRYEADPVGQNRRVHSLNLAPQHCFALGRRSLYGIAGVVVEGLSPSRRCDCQEKQNQPGCPFHAPPPWWRRMWGRSGGSSMDCDLIAA